ncbi:MAG: endonuclease III [Chloroflexi bacterium]|nr:MAG: endonuclease III [Chloroflexota bacterium]
MSPARDLRRPPPIGSSGVPFGRAHRYRRAPRSRTRPRPSGHFIPTSSALPQFPIPSGVVDRRRLRAIARRLAKAYGTPPPPRHLPPLEELVLTVLSQHTSDTNRDRAYADLRRRFADWDEVADAPLPALARAIRRGGLGPTKAVRIRAMLRGIRESSVPLDEHAFTDTPDQRLWDTLVALPGVGPKTAACVLLFSLDRPFFPVDTHVHRVAIRLGLVPPRADAVATQAAFQESVPDEEMYALHMNLIRHGREVCTAQRPRCSACVLRDLCPRVGVTSSR